MWKPSFQRLSFCSERAHRRMFTALLLSALPFALTGCNNNPYPTGESARPVLYRVLGDDPKTLDPSISYTVEEAAVIDNVYPAYFQYHYLKRDPYVLDLCLAAEEPKREKHAVTVEEKGKDGKVTRATKMGEMWTFRIKKGLRFQDDPCFPNGKGREITADDFLYCFKRMADPAVGCPIVSFFDDKILGMQDYEALQAARMKAKQPGDYTLPIEGLQRDPNDPYAFRIVLNQPYPQLRFLMAMHFTSPLPREAIKYYRTKENMGKELAQHAVGCGPFMMTELSKKQRIVLTKNPNYREEFYPSEGAPGDKEAGLLADAGKRLPRVEQVQYNIIKEGITSWNLFQQGYEDSSAVTQNNFQQVISTAGQLSEDMKRKGIRLEKEASANIYYYCFNMNDAVVGNVDKDGKTPLTGDAALKHRKLRQAMSCVIDSQADIDLFRSGLGIQAQFLLPPGVFGYDPNYKNAYRQNPVNLEKAKQLLAEAGYPNGLDAKTGERLTIFYDNAGTTAAGRQAVGLLIKNMEAIGIKIDSRVSLPNLWQEKVDKGDYQFVRYGWFADYPDPENFVFLLYGPNKRPGPNACNYANPEYDKLFEQMRVMDDGPERLAVINKLRDIAVEDCPWVYVNHDETLALFQPWLKNMKPHPISNDFPKYVSVDGALRARLQREWNQPNYLPMIAVVAFALIGSVPAASVVSKRRNRYVRKNRGGDA